LHVAVGNDYMSHLQDATSVELAVTQLLFRFCCM